ncbi:MAG: putative rane protein [Devosia sp.]|uniref:VanZ family protein n=1 Tax=Devosia sp. TaxID=1871048 RepID=UPI00263A1250|nr:VanZ family protein [Devosia sp.]MDB5530899.1 putative rane protein [Devosia sp.]
MNRIAILAAWLALIIIAIITVGPIDMRPVSGAPPQFERAVAFMIVGFLFALAYPKHIWWAVLVVVCATFGLELLQNLRPDRHGREADALAKFAGAAMGLAIGWLVDQIIARRAR